MKYHMYLKRLTLPILCLCLVLLVQTSWGQSQVNCSAHGYEVEDLDVSTTGGKYWMAESASDVQLNALRKEYYAPEVDFYWGVKPAQTVIPMPKSNLSINQCFIKITCKTFYLGGPNGATKSLNYNFHNSFVIVQCKKFVDLRDLFTHNVALLNSSRFIIICTDPDENSTSVINSRFNIEWFSSFRIYSHRKVKSYAYFNLGRLEYNDLNNNETIEDNEVLPDPSTVQIFARDLTIGGGYRIRSGHARMAYCGMRTMAKVPFYNSYSEKFPAKAAVLDGSGVPTPFVQYCNSETFEVVTDEGGSITASAEGVGAEYEIGFNLTQWVGGYIAYRGWVPPTNIGDVPPVCGRGSVDWNYDWIGGSNMNATNVQQALVKSADLQSKAFVRQRFAKRSKHKVEKKQEFKSYPNPANSKNIIDFTIPTTGKVTLLLYDLQGNLIETLISNQVLSAGHHSKYFNTTHLKSGMYTYRLISPEANSEKGDDRQRVEIRTQKIIIQH